MKSTCTYWNTLSSTYDRQWEIIEGSQGKLLQMTIAEDPETGDYTRLTRFLDGYSTEPFGAKSHNYPEELFVISGRLYDRAFDLWLEPGYYASRPPGEVHGPFKADGDVIILEISYLSQSQST
ncbi:cupin domain-containing protein [Roseofilum capinflatum]|uniref:Cupin domain-containing protein n=1 Tax=Roseofilum capinflatum BLCC-M114 TaxID=3022440 RepID=A0ABT7B9M7_9CYAN|nr:cupin domain-containing protein [Roseofilum capinflatum]MDJ1175878.1 cupin domain-containing protein [Roseofilum capinflatum BLCC-M114]